MCVGVRARADMCVLYNSAYSKTQTNPIAVELMVFVEDEESPRKVHLTLT